MEKETMNNKQRDYDKEPIIIEDYNYIFYIMYLIIGALIIFYIYSINPFGHDDSHSRTHRFNFVIFIVIVPGLFYYYRIMKSKRDILLTNNKITFREKDIIIEEIDISNIKFIKKTFHDYYIKGQEATEIESLLLYILLPIILPIQLINKFLFHFFKDGFKSYKLFDSIILFDKNDKFINILATTNNQYNELEIYMKNIAKVDLKTTEKFFKFNYVNEKRKN